MTAKAAEPMTEQEWLQNESGSLPEINRQPYPVHVHRIPAAAMGAERSGLATKFLGAIDTAFDKADDVLAARRAIDAGLRADADVLLSKSITAAANLLQARAVAKQAEDALAAALAVEDLAEIDAVEADRLLFELIREVAAQ